MSTEGTRVGYTRYYLLVKFTFYSVAGSQGNPDLSQIPQSIPSIHYCCRVRERFVFVFMYVRVRQTVRVCVRLFVFVFVSVFRCSCVVGCRVLFLFTLLRGDLRELPPGGEAREGVQVACALHAMVISISLPRKALHYH